ncbi:type I restriction endonuclease subunit R [Capnocytophaga catalasegens]|uniref:Type I restriction enzyme endonuclease subunit n=1 Tax=Capnocytophaga catalasegens TaxID=1004260 RepID=A0AAV5AU70_9FLAO|nr:type I restriction endonuclease subunit R [Capnocytophaga catalasegens]GIZ15818.1 DEAD/DEAH box helicase [Capnocytophaga catalasegens]GJM49830.1 DEAD/DEAH box helicase [Capnocytophaga catalasegens]GJM52995.1 DEAD/DEAH box helicase [Capnocytophaga catalasegens]
MSTYNTITQTNNFIVLDKYEKIDQSQASYQTEAALEREFIQDLINQGYEYRTDLTTTTALLANIREQLQTLNNVQFSDTEWERFVEEYLDKPSDTLVDKAQKIHRNHIYDFVFDDGHIQNIYLVDKQNVTRNSVQVISQFEQTGNHTNRYDVTILVNGLLLVQVELKKRGVAIREAFNQVHRYSKESFNSEHSLFKYIQIFVISNGTDTRYFANTTKRDKNSFDFTMNWARANNEAIKDLKDFTATFFQKNTMLNILLTYSVLDERNILMIMRPYQIAATERILWKIRSSYKNKNWAKKEGFGYIWHTTGSGKTLTSFKAAQLATRLDFIEKVFFVVDRKDLDYHTMKEYQRFSPDSVNGSANTAGLKKNIEKNGNKIIVTTIQKLNNLMKSEPNLEIYQKQVVFIFDECHRSQFGFTGTPIFPENAIGSETTADVFGRELHLYVIADAIRDEKVLKFKVDYNNVRPKFKEFETEKDEAKLSAAENKKALLHPNRIKEISEYILKNFRIKTHRNIAGTSGFNAMFAVSSIEAAKLYYEELNRLQKDSEKPLKIATIYSFSANEEQSAKGDIEDENFEPTAMESSAKEFLTKVINDYNAMFKTSYSVDAKQFQNYYKDLSQRVKDKEIDLLIVVGMFLTGFDAPTLNTLFVDKNLRYHGLIQAYSRTNRILDKTKPFGNIVTFRDLEKATIDAITLFGNTNTKNVVLEKSYTEYLEGFTDIVSGQARRGFIEVVNELQQKFSKPDEIIKESDKKEFVKLFGEYLKVENILQNYDEFTYLKNFQLIDANDTEVVEKFKEENFLTNEAIKLMKTIPVISERMEQDYRSTYNDIREWLRNQKSGNSNDDGGSLIDWEDVIFEVDLLKSQEINLDYIFQLIFGYNKKRKDKASLIEDVRRLLRSSLDNRAKESLIVDYINETNLDEIQDKAALVDSFFAYAQEKQKEEADTLITDENLNQEAAKRYITNSLKKEYASENGTELNAVLPKMSPLNPQYVTLKQRIFRKIAAFVEKFKGVGGEI